MSRDAALRAVCHEMRGARVDPSVRGTENEPGLMFGTDQLHVMGTNAALEYWARQIEAALALGEADEGVSERLARRVAELQPKLALTPAERAALEVALLVLRGDEYTKEERAEVAATIRAMLDERSANE